MWTCTSCGEIHEASFDACWKCGTARNPTALAEEPSEPPPGWVGPCMKCGGAMEAGVLVDGRRNPTVWFAESLEMIRLFSLFINKPHFYVTANRCSACGYLELYANT